MIKLKNSAMLVVAALCGYLALMTPDWKKELSAMSGVAYLPNNNYNELSGVESDVLMRSTATGDYTLFEVSNYAVIATNTPAITNDADYVYKATLSVGDGSGDVVVLLRRTSDNVWWYYRMADKVVTGDGAMPIMSSNAVIQYVAVGDIDGDGDDDILCRNTSTGAYAAYTMQLGLVTAANYAAPGPLNLTILPVGMADLDSDGDDELITRTSAGQYFVTRTENGVSEGNVNLAGIYANANYVYQFASDLNNDGFDDIVLRKMTGGGADIGLWTQWQYTRNTPGDVRFVVGLQTDLNLYNSITNIALHAIGDYNGDGYTDAILRDTRNYWWLSQMGPGGVPGDQLFIFLYANPDFTVQQSVD